MKKTFLAAIIAAAVTLPLATPSAEAKNWHNHGRYEQNQGNRYYDSNGRYREPRRLSRNDRIWRGRDGRYYCRRGNGTTGLIIGGAVGALLGRELDGGRDRTLGTILGAAGGGLLGREVDRGGLKCR